MPRKTPGFIYFTTVLYPDCSPHFIFMKDIEDGHNFTGLKIAYILHDRDKWVQADVLDKKCAEDDVGTLKKPHYHLFMRTTYPVSESAFSTAFSRLVGTPPERIEAVRSPVLYCAYLLHADAVSRMEGKFQYDKTCFRGDPSIILVNDEVSIADFVSFVDSWRNNYYDYDATFAGLTLALHFAGFDSFIRKNGFICTRIMSEAVKLKSEVCEALRNGFYIQKENNNEN